MAQPQQGQQLRLRVETISKSEMLVKAFDCCKLINVELDLRDMFQLVQRIEELQIPALLRWKSAFTTSFLKKIKEAIKSPPFPKRLRSELLSISDFNAFSIFYDQNVESPEMEPFYELVSKQAFIIVTSAEDLEKEKTRICDEKYWTAKTEFAQGALKLLAEGVKYLDMASYLKNLVLIDPNPATRSSSIEELPDGPRLLSAPSGN